MRLSHHDLLTHANDRLQLRAALSKTFLSDEMKDQRACSLDDRARPDNASDTPLSVHSGFALHDAPLVEDTASFRGLRFENVIEVPPRPLHAALHLHHQ